MPLDEGLILLLTSTSTPTMSPRCSLTYQHPDSAATPSTDTTIWCQTRGAHITLYLHRDTHRFPRCLAAHPLGASPEGPISFLTPPAHPKTASAVNSPIHMVPLQEGLIQILTTTSTLTIPPRCRPAHPHGASSGGGILIQSLTTTPTMPTRLTTGAPALCLRRRVPYHCLSLPAHPQHSTLSTGELTRCLSRKVHITPHSTTAPKSHPLCLPAHPHDASREGAHANPHLHQHTQITPTSSTGAACQ